MARSGPTPEPAKPYAPWLLTPRVREKEMSRVELFERIRREYRDEGVSIRGLAERHRVHRRTVREAVRSAVPAPRKTPVRAFVAAVRAELAGQAKGVTIGQEHGPGEEAEVDFGEFHAEVGGVALRLWLFVMRLSHSGRGFVVAFAHQAQEAFFEGHVRAFAHFGGVPAGRIRYDNLKPAVTRILLGRDRVENERFIALRSHYGFDSFFCEPGVEGAHEKGGVEGEVGRFRRAHLVPVPRVASLAELNQGIAERIATDDARHVGRRAETVGEAFAAERAWLRPLPAEPFDPAREFAARVDAKARVCVLQSWYSVPARLAGRRVQVRLGADRLEVLDGARVVAAHARSLHKGSQDLVLDHYLEVLARKPGALPGSTTLAQARKAGVFTAQHEAFWAAARHAHGDSAGTRALVEVLLVHRRLPAEVVLGGISAALKAGSTDPALVVIEARRLADLADAPAAVVVALERTSGRDARPAPSLGRYDALLDAGGLATVTALGARQ